MPLGSFGAVTVYLTALDSMCMRFACRVPIVPSFVGSIRKAGRRVVALKGNVSHELRRELVKHFSPKMFHL